MQRLLLSLLFLSPTFLAAQVVDIPDPNFLAALIEKGVDTNGDGMIQLSEAEAVIELLVVNKEISDLTGIEAFVNLEKLHCNVNKLTTIDMSQNPKLTRLNCRNNELTELNVTNNLALESLVCYSNALTELDVTNNLALDNLFCDSNKLTELDLTNNLALELLDCDSNEFTSLDVSQNVALTDIYCYSNELTSLDVTNNIALEVLWCDSNGLTTLDVSNNTVLRSFRCSYNDLTTVDVSNNLALRNFRCAFSNITTLDVSNNLALQELNVYGNDLTILDVSKNVSLIDLNCSSNDLTSIDLNSNLTLQDFRCFSNDLTTLDVTNNLELERLECDRNGLETLDVSNNLSLKELICSKMNLTSLDVTNNLILEYLSCRECALESLDLSNNSLLGEIRLDDSAIGHINIANGYISECNADFVINNDSLRYVCADEEEAAFVRDCVGDQVSINTFCNFSLNDGLNCLQGKQQYDIGGNCDGNSVHVSQIAFSIQDSTQEYKWWPAYSNDQYKMFFPSGPHIVKPCLDPMFFVSSPDSLVLDFLGVEDSVYQDFCVLPTGSGISDLAISLIPLDEARAGFESDYKIIIENQGNLFSSGTITLDLPMDSVQIISSSEAYVFSGNQVSWTYSDLPILSPQTITFRTRTNSPMDIPAINGGEILKFKAEVIPDMTDANPIDNTTSLCQTVVNSYDPNDKRCLQGRVLGESLVGSYLDYMIRFENTGSAAAINITVMDTLDTGVYDVSTFRLLDASHSVHVSQKANAIEFIFNDIYLSHLDSLNDGYVVFKIKTLDDLEVGDSIINDAAIYFDFNWPIFTNEALTIVGADQDGDGYSFVEDCDDTNSTIYPGAPELCDGLDNNCNESIDEDLDFITYYLDLDQDGYGDDTTAREECSQPDGLITTGGDCDDTNPNINPDAEDIVNNGIDEDCDGMDAVSSIYELEKLGITVYPNPVNDLLFIQQEGADLLKISLFNIEGKRVLDRNIDRGLSTLNLSDYTSGVYFLRVRKEDRVVHMRVVVE